MNGDILPSCIMSSKRCYYKGACPLGLRLRQGQGQSHRSHLSSAVRALLLLLAAVLFPIQSRSSKQLICPGVRSLSGVEATIDSNQKDFSAWIMASLSAQKWIPTVLARVGNGEWPKFGRKNRFWQRGCQCDRELFFMPLIIGGFAECVFCNLHFSVVG